MRLLVWWIAVVVGLFAVDRLLLWAEARGWLYYRRSKLHGGASIYHLMEIHSIVEPGFEEVMEIKVHEERQQDESGAPLGPQRLDDTKEEDQSG